MNVFSEAIERLPFLRRWFRWRYQPQIEVYLRYRRIYVFPTAAGFAFAMLLFVLLMTSINYNLNLGYGFTFLLGGVAVTSAVHAFRNLLYLTIFPGKAEPAFCGESVLFRVYVRHMRSVRRPALRLWIQGSSAMFNVPAAGDAMIELACLAHHRGRAPIGRVVIETTWPLGLLRAWSVFTLDAHALVYPAPEKNPPALPAPNLGGERGQRAGGEGDDDFAGLRAYNEADSLRHVAWKVFARDGVMLTKQFSGYEGTDLCLDWQTLPAHFDDEMRLSRLTAWVLMASQSEMLFMLVLPNQTVPLGRGFAHTQTCLRLLALYGERG